MQKKNSKYFAERQTLQEKKKSLNFGDLPMCQVYSQDTLHFVIKAQVRLH